jgi:hypothetical protein
MMNVNHSPIQYNNDTNTIQKVDVLTKSKKKRLRKKNKQKNKQSIIGDHVEQTISNNTITTTTATETTTGIVISPIFFFSIGKIIQYKNRKYGMCQTDFEDPYETCEENMAKSHRRSFTLPDVNLIRCNLMSCVFTLDQIEQFIKKEDWNRVIVILKHRKTYELLTDPKVLNMTKFGLGKIPRYIKQNKSMLLNILEKMDRMKIEITFVKPNLSVDGDIELTINCDKDPFDESASSPANKDELEKMQQISRYHKAIMADLMCTGGFSYDRGHRKLTKQEKEWKKGSSKNKSNGGKDKDDNNTLSNEDNSTSHPPPKSAIFERDKMTPVNPNPATKVNDFISINEQLINDLNTNEKKDCIDNYIKYMATISLGDNGFLSDCHIRANDDKNIL